MLSNMGGPTLIVIVFIVLLLFGAPKLPALAKSLGQSMKILKKEVTSEETSNAQSEAAAESSAAKAESAKAEAPSDEAK